MDQKCKTLSSKASYASGKMLRNRITLSPHKAYLCIQCMNGVDARAADSTPIAHAFYWMPACACVHMLGHMCISISPYIQKSLPCRVVKCEAEHYVKACVAEHYRVKV